MPQRANSADNSGAVPGPIYWMRVVSFNPGATIQFSGGTTIIVGDFLSYSTKRGWDRINLTGTVVIEYSNDKCEDFPGPVGGSVNATTMASFTAQTSRMVISPGEFAIACEAQDLVRAFFTLPGEPGVARVIRSIMASVVNNNGAVSAVVPVGGPQNVEFFVIDGDVDVGSIIWGSTLSLTATKGDKDRVALDCNLVQPTIGANLTIQFNTFFNGAIETAFVTVTNVTDQQ